MPHFLVEKSLLRGDHRAEITPSIKYSEYISRHQRLRLIVCKRRLSSNVVLIFYFDDIQHGSATSGGRSNEPEISTIVLFAIRNKSLIKGDVITRHSAGAEPFIETVATRSSV